MFKSYPVKTGSLSRFYPDNEVPQGFLGH